MKTHRVSGYTIMVMVPGEAARFMEYPHEDQANLALNNIVRAPVLKTMDDGTVQQVTAVAVDFIPSVSSLEPNEIHSIMEADRIVKASSNNKELVELQHPDIKKLLTDSAFIIAETGKVSKARIIDALNAYISFSEHHHNKPER